MFKKFKAFFLSLCLFLFGAVSANAQAPAALDTADLGPITQSIQLAASWLDKSVLPAVIGIAVAALIIVIAKFAAKKARPG
jgi:hypothetical protein